MRLLSLIIALFILAMVSLNMSASYRNVLLMSQDARLNDNAQLVAEDKFAELKVQITPSNGVDSTVVDNYKFVRTWTITDTGKVSQVTITVTWRAFNKTKNAQFARGI
ncbi:MAG: hypothetical protein PHF86_12565 [Candidatus Nanoarchaeia archaeon]|jgi:Tfp pilus assembly protein PilE|nr:hypothetical protein [Candidatus Nanoarchaeia archaeon]